MTQVELHGFKACADAKAEKWRIIEAFPDYEVSSLGKVRRRPGAKHGRGVAVLAPALSLGYEVVTLRRDCRSLSQRVHILVCEAFHGAKPSPRHQVAHNNGQKRDNRADNLRWATAEENQADRILHGTDIRGSEVAGAVLAEADIPRIRALIAQHVPSGVIAAAWGVSTSTIHLIKHRKIWRHA